MIKTISLKIVTCLCDSVQNESRMVGLLGDPGNGKSALLKENCTKDPTTRIIFQVGKSMRPINLYTEMYKRLLPGRVVPRTIYDIFVDIEEFLASSERKYLCCFDECGKLNPFSLELMHELRERSLSKMGYIFAGPFSWERKLKNWIMEDRNGMLEFGRRIEEFVSIDNPTKSEKSEYCRSRGITDTEVIEAIIRKCITFSDVVNEVNSYLRGK